MLVLGDQVHVVVQLALLTLLVDLVPYVVRIDIENMRVRAFFRQQDVLGQIVFLDQHGDFAIRVVEVAKDAGAALTGVDAGRINPVGDPFLTHVALVGRLLLRRFSGLDEWIERTNAVRAGVNASAAANTEVRINQHHTVGTLISRTAAIADFFAVNRLEDLTLAGKFRAGLDARRNAIFLVAFTVIAHDRQEPLFGIGERTRGFLLNDGPETPERHIIFGFAGHRTGAATDAFSQIHDHYPAWRSALGFCDFGTCGESGGPGHRHTCAFQHVAAINFRLVYFVHCLPLLFIVPSSIGYLISTEFRQGYWPLPSSSTAVQQIDGVLKVGIRFIQDGDGVLFVVDSVANANDVQELPPGGNLLPGFG